MDTATDVMRGIADPLELNGEDRQVDEARWREPGALAHSDARSAQGFLSTSRIVDQPHRVLGQRRDCEAVPGSAASAKRISAERECEPVL